MASPTSPHPESWCSSATAFGRTGPSPRGTAGAPPTRSRRERSKPASSSRDAPLILRAHLPCLLGEGRQPDALAPDVDVLGVLDRPRHDRVAVLAPDELGAVALLLPVCHAHTVEQEGVMRRGRVAARDGDLQHLEASPLEPGVEHRALGEDPSRGGTVVVDEPASRPALVVVEDLPQARAVALVGRAAGVGVAVGHRLELGPERRVSPHGWKGTSNGARRSPRRSCSTARRLAAAAAASPTVAAKPELATATRGVVSWTRRSTKHGASSTPRRRTPPIASRCSSGSPIAGSASSRWSKPPSQIA